MNHAAAPSTNATVVSTVVSPPPRLGRVQKRRRHVVALLSTLVLLPLMLLSGSAWTDGGAMHAAIETVGLLLAVACVIGRVACTLYIGGRKSAELITVGPYSVSRNPLYLFSLLGTIGLGLMAGSLAAGATFGLVYFLVFDRLIRREEAFLAASFPSSFGAYCDCTPRWLPRLSIWRSVDEISVRPRLLLNTLRDASVFVLMFPVLESIEWAQQAQWLPVLLRLP